MYNSKRMKPKRYIATALLASFFVVTMVSPVKVQAAVPPLLHFGGWATAWVPCTCSAAVWSWMAPLYLAPIPVTGPLVYAPYATLPLANFLVTVPATPHEGTYIPGVQACWMYAGFFCFVLPSIGLMAYVGTGLPGGK